MRAAHIVTVREGMVERIQTFPESMVTDGFDTREIESAFLEEVAARVSNFDEYTEEDKEAICDNGYEGFGAGSVQIFWSDE